MIAKGSSRTDAHDAVDYLLGKGAYAEHHKGEEIRLGEMGGFAFDDPYLCADFMDVAKLEKQRLKNEIYHAVIQPPFDQNLTDEEWEKCWAIYEEELGLVGHQFIEVIHAKKLSSGEGKNQFNEHRHRMYLRVHPETRKVQNNSHDFFKGEMASRRMEYELGHKIVPGKYTPEILKKASQENQTGFANWIKDQLGHNPKRVKANFQKRHNFAGQASADLPTRVAYYFTKATDLEAFSRGLESEGYYLCAGTKRDTWVIFDRNQNVKPGQAAKVVDVPRALAEYFKRKDKKKFSLPEFRKALEDRFGKFDRYHYALHDLDQVRRQWKLQPELIIRALSQHHIVFSQDEIRREVKKRTRDHEEIEAAVFAVIQEQDLISYSGIGADEDKIFFTTKDLVELEDLFVANTRKLARAKIKKINPKLLDNILEKKNAELRSAHGEDARLTDDQVAAIKLATSAKQIAIINGFAGAGKTTAMAAAYEAWNLCGKDVYGCAPSGKAQKALSESVPNSHTLHSLLAQIKSKKIRLNKNSVLVLDEGSMVDTPMFCDLVSQVKESGARLVVVKDDAQLKPVGAGHASRIITEICGQEILSNITRQEEEWMREATIKLNSGQTSAGLKDYDDRGCVEFVDPVNQYDETGQIVADYARMQTILHDLFRESREKSEDYDAAQQEAVRIAQLIGDNLVMSAPYIAELGINTKELSARLNFINPDYEGITWTEAWNMAKSDDFIAQAVKEYPSLLGRYSVLKGRVVDVWAEYLVEGGDMKDMLILAPTRQLVAEINRECRKRLRQEGGVEVDIATDIAREKGGKESDVFVGLKETNLDLEDVTRLETRSFAPGDRIIFKKNDAGIDVVNGALGTLVSTDPTEFVVRLDDGTERRFNPAKYRNFDYGWACTVHASQGTTVKHTLAAVTRHMQSDSLLVAGSRHKKSVRLFFAGEDFTNKEWAFRSVARANVKANIADHKERRGVAAEGSRNWQTSAIERLRDKIIDAAQQTVRKILKPKARLERDNNFSNGDVGPSF